LALAARHVEMELAGAVKLRNVSDYIAPNQACVVSLRGGKLSADDDEARPACLLRRLRPAVTAVR
jgi:hypothetical protein